MVDRLLAVAAQQQLRSVSPLTQCCVTITTMELLTEIELIAQMLESAKPKAPADHKTLQRSCGHYYYQGLRYDLTRSTTIRAWRDNEVCPLDAYKSAIVAAGGLKEFRKLLRKSDNEAAAVQAGKANMDSLKYDKELEYLRSKAPKIRRWLQGSLRKLGMKQVRSSGGSTYYTGTVANQKKIQVRISDHDVPWTVAREQNPNSWIHGMQFDFRLSLYVSKAEHESKLRELQKAMH